MPFRLPAGIRRSAAQGRRTSRRRSERRSIPRDRRNYRPRRQGRRPGAALYQRERLDVPGADQPVRNATPHGDGARAPTTSTRSADRVRATDRHRPLRDRRCRKSSPRWRARAACETRSRKRSAMRSAHEVVVNATRISRQLPVLTTWPLDAGPFITLPLVITQRSAHRAGSTSACIACRSTTRRETGNALAAPQARPRARRRAGARKIPVAVAIGTRSGAHVRRDRAATAGCSTSSRSPACCAASPSSSCARRRSTCQSPPTPSSCWKATSTTTTCASKGRSAIIPASTAWPTATRRFTSRASRTAAIRSTPRPSSASRRWKTRGSARPPNASSCRCCRSCCRKSST